MENGLICKQNSVWGFIGTYVNCHHSDSSCVWPLGMYFCFNFFLLAHSHVISTPATVTPGSCPGCLPSPAGWGFADTGGWGHLCRWYDVSCSVWYFHSALLLLICLICKSDCPVIYAGRTVHMWDGSIWQHCPSITAHNLHKCALQRKQTISTPVGKFCSSTFTEFSEYTAGGRYLRQTEFIWEDWWWPSVKHAFCFWYTV